VGLERGPLSLLSTIEELLLYQPSDCRLSAKLVPTFADRRCHVVSVTDPCGCILSFIDRRIHIEVSEISLLAGVHCPRNQRISFFLTCC
jgi:hypothetical protein